VLARTKKKLEEASSTIEAAEVRTRAMSRQLRSVESMPTREAQGLLGMAANEDDEQGAE
jgi:DNA recombination protein RmuC